MTQTILYEGRNLTLASGTGIATYTRTLAAIARELGYRTEALVGTKTPVSRKNPLLTEILMFDAEPKRSPTRILIELMEDVVGVPFGLRPVALQSSGMIVNPVADPLNGFEKIHAATRLFKVAHTHFQRYRRPAQVTVVSTPSLFHATHPVPIRVSGCPNVYTIHDIVPLRLPYTTLDNKSIFLRLISHLAATADHIVTVSEHSKDELIRFFKIDENRITNTYQSVSFPPYLLAKSEDEIASEIEMLFEVKKGEYFLFYGALEPKKNVGRLIDAYAASGTRRPLLIAGGDGWQNAADLAKIRHERFRVYRIQGDTITMERRVRRLPYVPLDQLVSLIRGARALLFPSIYEGFGLPVLEAMLLGTPVMTSTVSSLPEVAGDAAVLVDPHDIAAMARGIRSLDRDDSLCADLVVRGRHRAKMFSPAQYANRVGELYRRLL